MCSSNINYLNWSLSTPLMTNLYWRNYESYVDVLAGSLFYYPPNLARGLNHVEASRGAEDVRTYVSVYYSPSTQTFSVLTQPSA